ncbi:MAG: hypothetical protein HC819_12750 [Cyclobacteriaceae bacterium]|nr:hypothetical protein [Cyclobacteriaceae bacterium]
MKRTLLNFALLSMAAAMTFMMSCKEEKVEKVELHEYKVKVVLSGDKEFFSGNIALSPSEVNPPINFIDESTNQVVDEGVFPTGTVIELNKMKLGANSYKGDRKMGYLAVVYGFDYDKPTNPDPDQNPTLEGEITLYEDGKAVETQTFKVDKINITVNEHFEYNPWLD